MNRDFASASKRLSQATGTFRSSFVEVSKALGELAEQVEKTSMTDMTEKNRLKGLLEMLKKAEPEPDKGLPNELAYQSGWHDALKLALEYFE